MAAIGKGPHGEHPAARLQDACAAGGGPGGRAERGGSRQPAYGGATGWPERVGGPGGRRA